VVVGVVGIGDGWRAVRGIIVEPSVASEIQIALDDLNDPRVRRS
jgi:hypothetical protein